MKDYQWIEPSALSVSLSVAISGSHSWYFTPCISVTIVIVSETWLDNTVPDYEILPNGYTIFWKDRIGRRGGGVLLAFKSEITVWRRNDLETDCELVWCEFLSSLGQKILFGVYYRPPNTGVEYFSVYVIHLPSSITNLTKFFLQVILISLVLTGLIRFHSPLSLYI